jgi:oligopeptide transport system permease protein
MSAVLIGTAPIRPVKGRSLSQLAWQRFRRDRASMFGASLLVFVFVFCVAGPWLWGIDPNSQDLALGPQSPTRMHPFGTDQLGRDLLARVMAGGRVSLLVGIAGTFVALTIGVGWGAIAGYVGGRVDELMMRIVDVLYTIPFMFLVILLLAIFGRNFLLLFAAIGAVSWLTMARVVRGQVLTLRQREFVEGARALGASTPRIVFRHILPNTLGPVVVYATLLVPSIMLDEAFLSFLGLGVQPPRASWGVLVEIGADNMLFYPHLLAFPAIFLAVTLFALNFVGDGLRDALDPRAG